MIYTDQHVHCQSSPDSRTPLREMAAAARDRGMSAVCFTDHIDMDFGDLGDLRWETRKDIKLGKGIVSCGCCPRAR